jgi:predicted Zn-dependent protease
MEPGRYMVLLSAEAMGQILQYFLNSELDAGAADSGNSVFSKKPHGNKWHMQVLDRRITIRSDPEDPEGGYSYFTSGGLPNKKVDWVRDGVLEHLTYGPGYGRAMGHPTLANPDSIRMEGSQTASIEEMISRIRRGFYVNRFSSLQMFNQRNMMMSGTTRDGLLYIENGKIIKAAKNFRFMDSMMFFLNSMEAIGPSQRVCVGWAPEFSAWAGPIISCPVLVRDFTFTALADAV